MIWGVLQFPGSCDERDALNACTIASGGFGGHAKLVWHEETDLSGFDGIVVPGGFSYGDYLRAGAIARFAPAMEAVADFAAAGGPVLGICNGFQVLCESGLLPGALLTNESTRFICRQGDLIVQESDSLFLTGYEAGERISIPFKHQSGRFFAPPEMLEQIEFVHGFSQSANAPPEIKAALAGPTGKLTAAAKDIAKLVQAAVGGEGRAGALPPQTPPAAP